MLKLEDLTFYELRVDVFLRRGKTDQEGYGLVVSIPFANGRQRPVAAIQRWCALAKIRAGYLFRRVTRTVSDQPVGFIALPIPTPAAAPSPSAEPIHI